MSERASSLGRMVPAALVLVAVCSGCGAPIADRGGGPPADSLALTLASTEYDLADVGALVRAVEARSAGTVEVEVDLRERPGDADGERAAIRDVMEGKADLGFVGVHAFDAIGIASFQALVAPLLIDSHALQDAVLASEVSDDMLAELAGSGLVGIDVLPGPLRRPLGISRELSRASDFAESVLGAQTGTVAEMTLSAFGARVVDFVPDQLDGLDGIEAHMKLIANRSYDAGAAALTGDVILWPRPYVLFANAERFAALTPAQQALIRDAGDAARTDTGLLLDLESESYFVMCRRGLRVVSAGSRAVEDMQAALAPVYSALASDARTKSYLEQITAIRADLSAPPDAVAPCPAASPQSQPASSPTAVDGAWDACVTRDEHLAAGADAAEDQPANYGCLVLRLDRGRASVSHREVAQATPWNASASYVVDGHRITFYLDNGEVFQFRWSLFRDTLAFEKTGLGGPTSLVVKPFHRVDE